MYKLHHRHQESFRFETEHWAADEKPTYTHPDFPSFSPAWEGFDFQHRSRLTVRKNWSTLRSYSVLFLREGREHPLHTELKC